MQERFGIIGLQHFYHANGVDYTILSEKIPPKTHSYSKGQVLPRDYEDKREILTILMEMVEDVAERLRKNDKVCEEIHLHIRFSRRESNSGFSKSKRIATTSTTSQLKKAFERLFMAHWKGEAVRQLDVGCNRLSDDRCHQIDIFSMIERNRELEIDTIMDRIRTKHGKTSVFRGYNLLESSTFFDRSKKVGGHTGQTEV